MDPLLIQFFHAAVPDAPPARQPFRLQEDALKRGYIVPLGLLTADVEAFIERLPLELNTTFYRRWQDVVEKNRLPLLLSTRDLYSESSENSDFSEASSIQTYYESMWIARGLNIKYMKWNLPRLGELAEPDVEIELDDYRSYHRSKRSSLDKAK